MRSAALIVAIALQGSAAGQVCPPSAQFTEVALSAGIDFVHNSLGASSEVYFMSSGGVAGDFDKDGWPDLFVLGSGSRADALYINQGDGTFLDEAAAWGLASMHEGVGAAAGDYNNDGWLDIYVTSHSDNAGVTGPGQHRLYRNNGDGTFSDVAAAAGVNTTAVGRADGWSASFGDYDLDGDLDLAVAGWFEISGGNRLFRNDGDGTFTDVTDAADLGALIGANGFSPRFADMDGDRFPELIWTADFGSSLYFINDGDGTFTEATAAAGVGRESNGMGVTVADLNGDGLLDWYATSIDRQWNQTPRPGNAGNMLYLNQGNHVYAEVSDAAGVSAGWWGWGTSAIDVEHDGDLDLAETNGWYYQPWEGRPACLFLASGNGSYVEKAAAAGFVHNDEGRGLLDIDYDRDGDQDVVIFSNLGRVYLYRNEVIGPQGVRPCTNWLQVALETSCDASLAPHGVGARISITAGGRTQIREINAGTNFIAQSELIAHAGLKDAVLVDEVRVTWPDGSVTTRTGIAANQRLTIEPCVPCPSDVNGDGAVSPSDFSAWVAAFNTAGPGCDQNSDGACTSSDFSAWVSNFNAGCP
jgi:hypothetical protein